MKKETRFALNRIGLTMFLALICLIFISFLSSNVLAETKSGNSSLNYTENDVLLCLNDSLKLKETMTNEGFNTLRINDTIREAQETFDSQKALRDKKKPYDFSKVIEYCDKLNKIHEEAINAVDLLNSLKLFYNISIVEGMDTSNIDKTINEIKEDISAERYEEVSELVDKAYNEISTARASYTALNVFVDNTSTNIKQLFLKRWKIIVSLLIILVVLSFLYRVKISKWILQKKIEKLKIRKDTIRGLVMKIQEDYFQYGKIAEGEYNIKTKKFAEIIRDIDRQVPLLQEQLIKLGAKDLKTQKSVNKESKNITDSEPQKDKEKDKNKEKYKELKIRKTRKQNGKKAKSSRKR